MQLCKSTAAASFYFPGFVTEENTRKKQTTNSSLDATMLLLVGVSFLADDSARCAAKAKATTKHQEKQLGAHSRLRV